MGPANSNVNCHCLAMILSKSLKTLETWLSSFCSEMKRTHKYISRELPNLKTHSFGQYYDAAERFAILFQRLTYAVSELQLYTPALPAQRAFQMLFSCPHFTACACSPRACPTVQQRRQSWWFYKANKWLTDKYRFCQTSFLSRKIKKCIFVLF